MNNHDKIKSAFEDITPSEELVSLVRNMKKPSRKIAASPAVRFTAMAASLFVVMGLGAAVSGMIDIDFNTVFGGYVRVDDSTLANSLMGQVSSVSYKVSDDDYKITVTGVTGSKNTLLAIAEISRVDGSPVVDSFINKPESSWLNTFSQKFEISGHYGSAGGSYGAFVTENGNIGISLDISSELPLSGKTITMEGINFYPGELYRDFLDKNQISRHITKDYCGYVHWNNGNEPVDINDESVMGLPLEWKISFKYTASDKALTAKKCVSPADKTVLYLDVSRLKDVSGTMYNDGKLTEIENICTVEEIEVSAADIIFSFSYPLNDYEFNDVYSVTNSEKNEAYLICADGSHIPLKFAGYSGRVSDGLSHRQMHFSCMDDTDVIRQFIDADNVTGFYFNGVVYELE